MRIINIGSRVVNNYIIETHIGYVVIDTGYAGGYNNFLKRLTRSGIDKTDIKFVFITHVHDDHVGFLNELLRDTDATLILHRESPERLLKGRNELIGGCPNLLAKLFVKSMNIVGKGKHEFPVAEVNNCDKLVLWTGNNQFFRELGVELDIISLPGHTSDSIGLLTGNGDLLCGDACMNNFPSIKRNIIWIENLDDYRKSWNTMIQSSAHTIYPSHGSPFPKKDLIRYSSYLEKIKIQ